MRKGIIVNLKRFKTFDYVNLNKIFLVLCAVFIGGIVIGCTSFSKNGWLLKTAESFLKNYISVQSEYKFLKKFSAFAFRYLALLAMYFLSGTSMLGVAVAPFVTLWHGIFWGSVSSYLYANYKLTGIAFNAIILIPPTAIFAVACFFAAKYSLNFSLSVAKLTLPRNKPASLYTDFKNFCIKYLILVSVSVLCAAIEVVLNLLFLKLFNF